MFVLSLWHPEPPLTAAAPAALNCGVVSRFVQRLLMASFGKLLVH